MTHLLIPIAEIEKKKILFKNLITIETRDKKEGWKDLVADTVTALSVYNCLDSLGKQISLDEKEIEAKAKKYSKLLVESQTIDNHERTWIESIYKQVLLDLLSKNL